MDNNKEIPQLQEQILQYMCEFYRESHKFPTISEIAQQLEQTEIHIGRVLKRMRKSNFIQFDENNQPLFTDLAMKQFDVKKPILKKIKELFH